MVMVLQRSIENFSKDQFQLIKARVHVDNNRPVYSTFFAYNFECGRSWGNEDLNSYCRIQFTNRHICTGTPAKTISVARTVFHGCRLTCWLTLSSYVGRKILLLGLIHLVALGFFPNILPQRTFTSASSYVFLLSHRLLAVSHFEPAHARKAFPCFDEPSFKASFNISIIHDPQFYALSNMPRAWLVTRKDGLVEEHFLPSVNMSTYLVAFAVVDFKYKEKMASSGVLVSFT